MKANSKITVESLRRDGYKVRVTHYRDYIGEDNVFRMTKHEAVGAKGLTLDSFGGHTVIEVTTPDGSELRGKYNCNINKQFHRKLAVRIALGRALMGVN